MPGPILKKPAGIAGFLVPALLAAGLSSTSAGAQVRASSDYLQRMDTDRNARVSLNEYQAWMGYAFERMDRNGDGLLVSAELPGGRGKSISLVAHRESLAAAFRRQDSNRDGTLDARELAAPPQ
jgi:Ca2+-binding EF-hand superfamily protein